MKQWMFMILLACTPALTLAQSTDTTGYRYRGGNDRPEHGALHRRMDKFVDKDGDGICDDRASGLGVRRAGQGMRMMEKRIGRGSIGQGREMKQQKGKKR
ncbi:MAG TPA: hypothetical protein VK470_03285 [Bacteroidota bacterium]|nr:hypothetical protein [Bacteroidota bacterium]